MANMLRLKDKTAIITGAAQGIGACIAKEFAKQGASLLLWDVNEAQLNMLAAQIQSDFGVSVLAQQVDVTDKESIANAAQLGLLEFNKIDVLINNAGINVFSEPLELTQNDWNKCLSVDLEGVWNCIQAVLPSMLEANYGHIVNIASVHGHKIIRGSFPYPVAKHGLIGMTRALGIEYADRGVRVNSISPGLIDTPLAKTYFDTFDDPQAAREKERQTLPCKRLGKPEEVANTALFLASDEARFINATDILIDGGRSQVYCD